MTNLKRIRISAGFSKDKLSELSNVSISLISKYESKENTINTAQVSTVHKLATALNVRIEDLLDDIDNIEGEWIPLGDWVLSCSICDNMVEEPDSENCFKFCPWCGAKMNPVINQD